MNRYTVVFASALLLTLAMVAPSGAQAPLGPKGAEEEGGRRTAAPAESEVAPDIEVDSLPLAGAAAVLEQRLQDTLAALARVESDQIRHARRHAQTLAELETLRRRLDQEAANHAKTLDRTQAEIAQQERRIAQLTERQGKLPSHPSVLAATADLQEVRTALEEQKMQFEATQDEIEAKRETVNALVNAELTRREELAAAEQKLRARERKIAVQLQRVQLVGRIEEERASLEAERTNLELKRQREEELQRLEAEHERLVDRSAREEAYRHAFEATLKGWSEEGQRALEAATAHPEIALRARLALDLLREGREDAARKLLTQLTKEEGPVGSWAKRLLPRLSSGAHLDQAGVPSVSEIRPFDRDSQAEALALIQAASRATDGLSALEPLKKLEGLQGTWSLRPLIPLFQHQAEAVRQQCMRIAQAQADPEAIPALLARLTDPSFGVRQSAAKALERTETVMRMREHYMDVYRAWQQREGERKRLR